MPAKERANPAGRRLGRQSLGSPALVARPLCWYNLAVMDCPSCGRSNLEEARYCTGCRDPLLAEHQCSNCRTVNVDDAQFCTSCGTVLSCPSCGRRDVGDGQFCQDCGQFLTVPGGIALAGLGQRVGATLLDVVLFFLTLIIGYVIWSLGFTLRNGQTPGKQLVGIRVIRADGTPSD